MGAVIQSKILGVTGQCVKSIRLSDSGEVMVYCERDRRRKPRLEGAQREATTILTEGGSVPIVGT